MPATQESTAVIEAKLNAFSSAELQDMRTQLMVHLAKIEEQVKKLKIEIAIIDKHLGNRNNAAI